MFLSILLFSVYVFIMLANVLTLGIMLKLLIVAVLLTFCDPEWFKRVVFMLGKVSVYG